MALCAICCWMLKFQCSVYEVFQSFGNTESVRVLGISLFNGNGKAIPGETTEADWPMPGTFDGVDCAAAATSAEWKMPYPQRITVRFERPGLYAKPMRGAKFSLGASNRDVPVGSTSRVAGL